MQFKERKYNVNRDGTVFESQVQARGIQKYHVNQDSEAQLRVTVEEGNTMSILTVQRSLREREQNNNGEFGILMVVLGHIIKVNGPQPCR